MFRNLLSVMMLFVAIAAVGCQQSGDPTGDARNSTNSEPGEQSFSAATTARSPNVVTASDQIGNSPAARASGGALSAISPGASGEFRLGLTADSPPEEVCRVFLDLLQSGDRISAQLLLTDVARLETGRASLELDAPGGAEATFQVDSARYATAEQTIAEVDCRFTCPGEPQATLLTWSMRRQSSGWKIAGMLVDLGNDTPDLLSFESAADLARIRQSVDESSQAPRTASENGASGIR